MKKFEAELNREVWRRLMLGEASLGDLPLSTADGRKQLQGLQAPPVEVLEDHRSAVGSIKHVAAPTLRNAGWQSLDFTGCKLDSLRFFDCELTNCVFDSVQFKDLRLWGNVLTECSFRGASLRSAALGGVRNGKRNRFVNIDWSNADLRRTAYEAADFIDCQFSNAKLEDINFQSSTFLNCVFRGELRDVTFNGSGLQREAGAGRELQNVDLRGAVLRSVEFRGLVLDGVQLPEDDMHLIFRDCVHVLDTALATLSLRDDVTARKLLAYVGVIRKWIAPAQVQAVVNLEDLREVIGDDGPARFLEAVGATSH